MKKTILLLTIVLFPLSMAYASTADIEAAIMDKKYEEAKILSLKQLKMPLPPEERIAVEYYLGLSQLRLNQPASARDAFQVVMAASDSQDLYDRAALGMIEALYTQGFYKQALKQGKELLYKSPHSSSMSLIYLKLARTHLKLTQWQVAKNYLQKLINEFPESAEAVTARHLLEEKEYFSVQVGSYKEQEKAQALTAKLKSDGQYAYIVETTAGQSEKFYRVRVGQMTSLSDAQTLEAKLANLGYPTLIYP